VKNRITELLGVQHPIVQAPMGWIARAQLASAVSNAGGLGIIETSSGRIDEVKPVAQILRETMAEFEAVIGEMGAKYGRAAQPA
jgi:enoyl-[acyl-carrier protein] reductase II